MPIYKNTSMPFLFQQLEQQLKLILQRLPVMNFQYISQSLQTQRCNQCKASIGKIQQRYFCCERSINVCGKCSKNPCRKCGKKRENKIIFVECSNGRCRRIYDIEDMFYDFKGNYYICPKCIRKDFQFYYQNALKTNHEPEDVSLGSKSVYPYKDLVNYFKNWCFSCANKIGKQAAYEMIRGPRICGNCIALNTQTLAHIIRCISCEGYIHTMQEIYQTFGNETEVICIYCAEKHKEQLEKASKQIGQKLKHTQLSKLSSVKSSKFKSALKIFISNSQIKNQNEHQLKIHPSSSKISSANSYEQEQQDVQLRVKHQKADSMCNVCNSAFEQSKLFVIKKSDQRIVTSILKLIDQNKGQIKLCPLCLTAEVVDQGQTVQFKGPSTRNLKILEQNVKKPEIKILNILKHN